ncbi:grainyhead-like [Modicella reniformis]|uniref:Grainyhead-like n=1 Tax=Modicella reniformis TaxID=1440133 RepID=A0A9P6IJ69_9FUNG|nr:grainyhead-like [Modicella reniformis]
MDTYLDDNGEGSKDEANGNRHSNRGGPGSDSSAMERAFAKIKLFRDKGAERKNKDDHKQLEKMWDKMRGKNADTNPLVNMLAPVQSVSLFAECLDPPEGSGEEETLDLSETLAHDSQGKSGNHSESSAGKQGASDTNGSSNSNNGSGDGGGGGGDDGVESFSSRQDPDSSLSPSSTGDQSNALVVPNKKRRRPTEEDGGTSSTTSTTTTSNHGDSDSQGVYDPHQSQVGFVSSSLTVPTLGAAATGAGLGPGPGPGPGAGPGEGMVVSSSTTSSELLLDRDLSYVPQQRKKARPVLCLYIKIGGETVYRAVYLEKYTLADLTQKLSEKLEIQSSTISHVYRKTLRKELMVRVDDAMVAQMTDELDMVVEYDFNQQDGSVNLTLKY